MKRWYVVQIYAGYEDMIIADMNRHIKQEELEDYFGEILVPSAKVQSMFEAAAEPSAHHLFPGYLLVEAEMTPEVIRLVESTPRVIRFLGGKEPSPLSQKEIDRIKAQVKGEVVVSSKEVDFVVGSEVEISQGPFAGFLGVIEHVDEEHERLTVMVSIFGRMTPVELSFEQVKR
jgi:transcriptional antiterminator NusG